MSNLKNESVDRLFKAFLCLKSEEECYAFFEDLCTVKEIKDMAQRLETAILLSQGNSYLQIAEKAGTSAATVSRVNRCLEYGAGGYKTIIERIAGEEDGN